MNNEQSLQRWWRHMNQQKYFIITEELWDEEDKMKENKVLNMADEKQKKKNKKNET